MTSVNGITQLGNESEVNGEKGDRQLKKNHQQKKTVVLENSRLKQRQNSISLFCDHLNFLQVLRFKLSFTLCVVVNIQLLVQFSYQNKHGFHS